MATFSHLSMIFNRLRIMELTVAGRDVRRRRSTTPAARRPAVARRARRGAASFRRDRVGPEPAGAVAALAVVGGLDAGRRVDAGPGAGSSSAAAPPATWPPLDPTVSRRHARVTIGADGDVEVADLGSRNGTWLVARAAPTRWRWGRGSVALPPTATVRSARSRWR